MVANKLKMKDLTSQNNDLMVVERVLQQLTDKIELLQRKNKKCQAILEKHETFRKTMGKVLHDISSPLLSLQTIVDSKDDKLPKQIRIAMRSAVINATDITNQALNQFNPKKIALNENNKRQTVLISTILCGRRQSTPGLPGGE